MTVFLLSYSHSHIIVMLADDMACNARNPRPGESLVFPTLFVSPLISLIMIFHRNTCRRCRKLWYTITDTFPYIGFKPLCFTDLWAEIYQGPPYKKWFLRYKILTGKITFQIRHFHIVTAIPVTDFPKSKAIVEVYYNILQACQSCFVFTSSLSEDDYRTGCWNVSHCQQQSYVELGPRSPG